jgi:FAD synthetase
MKRILVFGTFDHLHPGHRYVLNQAAKRGELNVVVARDSTVQRIKNLTPQHNEMQRKQMIEEAYPDANVVLGDTKNYLIPVKAIKPDLILLGYDQRLPNNITEADLGCPIERLEAFEPEKWKSSLLRKTSPSPASANEGNKVVLP